MRVGNDRKPPVGPRGRAPALSVVVAVSIGIVADWYLQFPFVPSLLIAFCLSLLWLCLFQIRSSDCDLSRTALRGFRVPTFSVWVLLSACGFLGAAWHQFQWSLIRTDDLLAFATETARPARLVARVETDPVLVHPTPTDFPTALPKRSRTIANLRARLLIRGQEQIPVSGLVRMEVIGDLGPLAPGTIVDVLGVISRPQPVGNPGGFDFRMFLRERGIHTIIRGEFPESIRIVEAAPGGIWSYLRSWQKACADRLRQRLSSVNAPVAIALLLGPRTDIPKDLKDAFLQTGTVHFLAISGANVAILVMFLWPMRQMLRIPQRWGLFLIGAVVWGYVLITDADPPVVRAAVIVTMWLLSLSVGRGLASVNQLALAALIILIRNPHDLFQAGAQLSFLAIMALHWLAGQAWVTREQPVDPLDELTRPLWRTWLSWWLGKIWLALAASAVVWLFTLPLILARFHLVSPVGFLANVFLQLWMVLTLLLGYACLAGVIFFSPLAWLCAPVFDFCLLIFAGTVRYAAATPGGHLQVPGPADWWLAGYCALLIPLALGILKRSSRRQVWRCLAVWCLVGCICSLPPRSNPGLRCTFLSVGHGAAILLEFPNRRTILYDAGSLEDASRASQAVEHLLVERGLMHLDAILISHADIDHFNGVPRLLQELSVGELFISPAFLDFKQESVQRVCLAAVQALVPIKLVWSGDQLKCGPDVTVEILHPVVRGPGGDDNANSVVLSVQYAGKRILLTGDLEKGGLLEFLSHAPRQHDILLAPHHGSQKANPPELARWASPRWVVVSGGHDAAWTKLRESYGEGATLLSTSKHGAVTFEINQEGEINVQTHLPPVPLAVSHE